MNRGAMDPPPDGRDCPAEAFDDLLRLYAALDDRLREIGVACRQCGECCDFAKNDYRLYASFLERMLVVHRHGPPRLAPSGVCGFLVEGRCAIHTSRPLGCRTFFCDRAYKALEQDLYHECQRQLRAVTEKHHLPWEYVYFFGD